MTKPRKQGGKQQPENQGRNLAADEAHLWQAVTDGVTPLNKTQNKVTQVIKTPDRKSTKKPKSSVSQVGPAEKAESLPISQGDAPGLDKRTQMRLKRGQLSVEGRIDLHGMTQAQAHHALEHFLGASQNAGRRTVLVITGKGFKPGGGIGVLKQAVPKWLNEQPNRSRVQGFSHASPRDGGEGALYVRLKRK